MKPDYDTWVSSRLREKNLRCRFEVGRPCVPLRSDAECKKCYEADCAEAERQQRDNVPPGAVCV